LFSIDYPTLTDRQISKIAMEFPRTWGGWAEPGRRLQLKLGSALWFGHHRAA